MKCFCRFHIHVYAICDLILTFCKVCVFYRRHWPLLYVPNSNTMYRPEMWYLKLTYQRQLICYRCCCFSICFKILYTFICLLKNTCMTFKNVQLHVRIILLMFSVFAHFGIHVPEERSNIFIRPSSDGTYYGMVMSVRPSVRHSFPHFSPTCFDILIWNFVYHFIVMHVRSSSNAINFRHFLQELCSFLTLNSYKYAVFRTFLLHALTYWVQILYMTLFKCTTEQVWVSSFCFNFCWSYASLWT